MLQQRSAAEWISRLNFFDCLYEESVEKYLETAFCLYEDFDWATHFYKQSHDYEGPDDDILNAYVIEVPLLMTDIAQSQHQLASEMFDTVNSIVFEGWEKDGHIKKNEFGEYEIDDINYFETCFEHHFYDYLDNFIEDLDCIWRTHCWFFSKLKWSHAKKKYQISTYNQPVRKVW
jgi:hypothetical protein